jgi:DNA-binding transcriptional MerR regulator
LGSTASRSTPAALPESLRVSESAAGFVDSREVERPNGSWPHSLGQQPTLRVGDVLAALSGEFPSLSPSKLRFLDAQGLVCPHRTASGYRHYSISHIERLRYVLRQQRDAYAPLSVIKARLDELDAGLAYEPVSLSAVGDAGEAVALSEVATVANTSVDTIAALVDDGLVDLVSPGHVSRDSVRLVSAAARFLESGADVREVRTLVRAAAREYEAARRAAAPLKRRDDAVAADAAIEARLEAAGELFAAAVESARATGE